MKKTLKEGDKATSQGYGLHITVGSVVDGNGHIVEKVDGSYE